MRLSVVVCQGVPGIIISDILAVILGQEISPVGGIAISGNRGRCSAGRLLLHGCMIPHWAVIIYIERLQERYYAYAYYTPSVNFSPQSSYGFSSGRSLGKMSPKQEYESVLLT